MNGKSQVKKTLDEKFAQSAHLMNQHELATSFAAVTKRERRLQNEISG